MAASLRTLLPRSTRSLRARAPTTTTTTTTTTSFVSQTRRWQSVQPQQHPQSAPLEAPDAQNPKLTRIDADALQITQTTTPKQLTPNNELVFGRTFTDHMLTCEWTAADGWMPPRITPYQNFSLDPATCVFHYAFECFEGMKAYKDQQGHVRLFRPEKNMERMNKSSARIALPRFEGNKVIELIKKLCEVDSRFIPSAKGYSLYLRPTMIGTQRTLGVGPPGSAMLFVIASPVGPYYPTGFKAISLEATTYAVRAWPGGVGASKLGANYAPCIVPQMQAAQRGFHQNLWLFEDVDPATGQKEDYITEVGTMNLFAAMTNKDGQKELMTAPLDGTILEGVTRDSVLELAQEKLGPQGWKISERKFHMRELSEAHDEGRLHEVFGAGTAAIVSPIRNISYRGRTIDCGLPAESEVGPIAKLMKDTIESIQYGEIEHPWSVRI